MKRHNDTAERIIKLEGFAFALASLTGKELPEARAMLKAAILNALQDEFNRGAELQRRSMEGNAQIDALERMINR